MIDKIVLVLKWVWETALKLAFLIYVFGSMVVGGEILLAELAEKYLGGFKSTTELAVLLALIIAPMSLLGVIYLKEQRIDKKKDDK